MLFGFVRLDSYPTDTLCHENTSTVYLNNVYTKRGIINYKSPKRDLQSASIGSGTIDRPLIS